MTGAGLFIPLSELKALRRAAANRCLEALRRRPSSQGLSSTLVLPSMLEHISTASESSPLSSAAARPVALIGALSYSAGSLTPHTSDTTTSSSSSSETSRHSRTVEARKGAGYRTLHSASDEQANSSSGNGRSGHPQQQQTQLRLLCRTMAQVCSSFRSICRISTLTFETSFQDHLLEIRSVL